MNRSINNIPYIKKHIKFKNIKNNINDLKKKI